MHRYKPLQPGRLPVLEARPVSENELPGQTIAPSAVSSIASVDLKRRIAYEARHACDVLLLGFGDGAVLMDCLQNWQQQQKQSVAIASVLPRLHVVIVDEYPLHWADVLQCLRSNAAWTHWSAAFQKQYRPLLPGVHRMKFFGDDVRIDWVCGEAQAWLAASLGRFDIAVLSSGPLSLPGQKPVWRARTFYDLRRRLRMGGILVSDIKDASLAIEHRQWAQYANWVYEPDSAAAGLSIDCWHPGGEGDQEGTATHPAREPWTVLRHVSQGRPQRLKDLQVAVVGAGLAGIQVAAALARLGAHVTVFDASQTVCEGASGNPVGAFHPHVSIDDAMVSRLSRLGINATVSSLEELTRLSYLQRGIDWDLPGHIQLFDDTEDKHRFLKALHTLQWPTDELDVLCPDDIMNRLGFKPAQSGLWLKQAGWVKPRRWCEALLARCADDHRSGLVSGTVDLKMGCDVLTIAERFDDRNADAVRCARNAAEITWKSSADPNNAAFFDRVVLAAAQGSLPLWKQPGTEQKTVKGQVSFIKAPGPLAAVVSGASYAIDMQTGQWLIGATFERPAADTAVTEQAHASNRAALQRAFPAMSKTDIIGGRSAVRCAWPDRLPALGPALRDDGALSDVVWYATAYGSRGLTWAAMGAEWLADCWAGYTPALTQDLAAAVFPGRFFSRASNSKPTLPSLPSTR